jgi:hypothetical protein
MPEESQIKSCEYQHDADIHDQPFPKSVSEEPEIYPDYDGCHRQHVKNCDDLSVHVGLLSRPTEAQFTRPTSA